MPTLTRASTGILKNFDTHTDPAHGRPLPKGHALFPTLRAHMDRQRIWVTDWVRHLREVPARAPSLGMWSQPMADACTPAVVEYQRRGAVQAVGDVLRAVAAKLAASRGTPPKAARRLLLRNPTPNATPALPSVPTIEDILRDAFGFFNSEVADAARAAAWLFCSSTNATATAALAAAVADAREALARGLEQGEALAVLTVRVQQHFGDPRRAATIAMTEASRAVHAGQQAVAEATNGIVTGKTWLASTDACPRCLKLNGLTVPLNEHFAVVGEAGPYAVVEHPPLHPHCMCSSYFEVDL